MDKYFSQRFIIKPEEFAALMKMRLGQVNHDDQRVIDNFLDHVAKRRGFSSWQEAYFKQNPME